VPGSLALSFLVAWWLVFGPVALGGPATFTIVTGRSMEPTFQDGDLVIARERSRYEVGDVVVFPVSRGRVVIHRIIEGSPTAGWITQGDNNDRRDSWIVPDPAILGEKWLSFPGAGLPFRWTQENPLAFGAVVALVVTLSVVGLRRRLRLHPFLADAVRTGERVSSVAERPAMEVLLLCLACFVTAVASIGIGLLATVGKLLSAGSLVLLVPGGLSLGAVVFLVRRLGDGVGVEEPRASLFVLSSRCWRVDRLPEVLDYVDHPSPRSLRTLLDRFRLPVLLHQDLNGAQTYLTITRNAIAHRWRPVNSDPVDESPALPVAVAPALPPTAAPMPLHDSTRTPTSTVDLTDLPWPPPDTSQLRPPPVPDLVGAGVWAPPSRDP